MHLSYLLIAAHGSLVLANPLQGTASSVAERQTDGVMNALGPENDPSAYSQLVSGAYQYYFSGSYRPGKTIFMQSSGSLNTVLADQSNNHSIYTSQYAPGSVGLFRFGPNNHIIYFTEFSSSNSSDAYFTVLQNRGSDMTTGWTNIGILKDLNGQVINKCHDPQLFSHPNGKNYILYSLNSNTINIAELVNATTAKVPIKVVGSGTTTEAPGALVHNSTLNIYWSENEFYNSSYNVLRLSVSTTSDPMNATTWQKPNTKVILASNFTVGVYGPGSASTFTGPDGTPWMAYDCSLNRTSFNPTPGNTVRKVQAQPVVFNGGMMAVMYPVKPTRFVTS